MAVHRHRISWTDERLDDLNQTVRDGFARNDREHQELRTEMNHRFDRVDERFDRIEERFDSLQRVMIIGMFGMMASVVAAVVGAVIAVG